MSRPSTSRNETEQRIREDVERFVSIYAKADRLQTERDEQRSRADRLQFCYEQSELRCSVLQTERDHYALQVARLQEQLKSIGRYFTQQSEIAREWAVEAELAPYRVKSNAISVQVDDGVEVPQFLQQGPDTEFVQ
jgi:hypothetical protein